jgi:hypothetical protein
VIFPTPLPDNDNNDDNGDNDDTYDNDDTDDGEFKNKSLSYICTYIYIYIYIYMTMMMGGGMIMMKKDMMTIVYDVVLPLP